MERCNIMFGLLLYFYGIIGVVRAFVMVIVVPSRVRNPKQAAIFRDRPYLACMLIESSFGTILSEKYCLKKEESKHISLV